MYEPVNLPTLSCPLCTLPHSLCVATFLEAYNSVPVSIMSDQVWEQDPHGAMDFNTHDPIDFSPYILAVNAPQVNGFQGAFESSGT